jgi:predicted alpha/beta-fold hydrolase
MSSHAVLLLQVVDHVHKRFPNSTLFAAGWSLGANILVNYLGEQVRLAACLTVYVALFLPCAVRLQAALAV